jgi:hypothetical protein
MDSPQGLAPQSAIKARLGAFRTYLSNVAGLTPDDKAFDSFCIRLQLLFLISGALKKQLAASETHEAQLCDLYATLRFTDAMISNSKHKIHRRMMLFLSLTPIEEILAVYNCQCFPLEDQVLFSLNLF